MRRSLDSLKVVALLVAVGAFGFYTQLSKQVEAGVSLRSLTSVNTSVGFLKRTAFIANNKVLPIVPAVLNDPLAIATNPHTANQPVQARSHRSMQSETYRDLQSLIYLFSFKLLRKGDFELAPFDPNQTVASRYASNVAFQGKDVSALYGVGLRDEDASAAAIHHEDVSALYGVGLRNDTEQVAHWQSFDRSTVKILSDFRRVLAKEADLTVDGLEILEDGTIRLNELEAAPGAAHYWLEDPDAAWW